MYSYIKFSDGHGQCAFGISKLFANSRTWCLYLKRYYLPSSESFEILGYFQNYKSARLALDMVACASGEVIYNDMSSV